MVYPHHIHLIHDTFPLKDRVSRLLNNMPTVIVSGFKGIKKMSRVRSVISDDAVSKVLSKLTGYVHFSFRQGFGTRNLRLYVDNRA